MQIEIKEAAEKAGAHLGWTSEHTERAAVEYERFLVLAQEHPTEPLVPSVDVDHVWHRHIGFEVYAKARPALPVHETHTTHNRDQLFAKTLELYTRHFGTPSEIWRLPADCQINDVPPPKLPQY